jgi:5S rRNA maturation endonuclease (ribonuclease M5)
MPVEGREDKNKMPVEGREDKNKMPAEGREDKNKMPDEGREDKNKLRTIKNYKCKIPVGDTSTKTEPIQYLRRKLHLLSSKIILM